MFCLGGKLFFLVRDGVSWCNNISRFYANDVVDANFAIFNKYFGVSAGTDTRLSNKTNQTHECVYQNNQPEVFSVTKTAVVSKLW